MDIPFMRLDRQVADLKEQILECTASVLQHGRVLQGPEVAQFEHQLAELMHMPSAVALNSCTDALMLSLKALDLKPGGRVAVTAFSFVASASAIALAGGIPVFIDIDRYYMSQREHLLEMIRKGQIDGIIAVHLYGQMMDLTEIYAEAQKSGIFVIEDAAQCLGATRNGHPPGQNSDITCVSFDPTKVIGAYGSGGAALTRDESLRQKLVRLRYHGQAENRIYEEIGHNSQMPSVQAAWLSLKLQHIESWQQRRLQIAESFNHQLGDIPGVQIPEVMDGNTHVFHKYVLGIEHNRDALAAHLKEQGIATSVHYALPLDQQPCFANLATTQSPCANAERVAKHVLSLPMYPELTEEEVTYICRQIRNFFVAPPA